MNSDANSQRTNRQPALLGWLKDIGEPAPVPVAEEESYHPPTFGEQSDDMLVESNTYEALECRDEPEHRVTIGAFLDGVQRTVQWRFVYAPKNGARVPVHIAHIAAGVVKREPRTRKLYLLPELTASRLLLVGPFSGLKQSGLTVPLNADEALLDTSASVFRLPATPNEWIVCDTTFCGVDKERDQKPIGDVLEGDLLFQEGLVRSRAQGRVALLRSLLELSLLGKYQGSHAESDGWILVDGPLFFLDKHRKRYRQANQLDEDTVLRRAVGVIKTMRLRPRNPSVLASLKPLERTPVARITREVDIKGSGGRPDDEGSYARAHLTWFLRLPPTSAGRAPIGSLHEIVRLDVHCTTLGFYRSDDITPEQFAPWVPLINSLSRAVAKEIWPCTRRGVWPQRSSNLFPIQELERVLHASLYPRRFLRAYEVR